MIIFFFEVPNHLIKIMLFFSRTRETLTYLLLFSLEKSSFGASVLQTEVKLFSTFSHCGGHNFDMNFYISTEQFRGVPSKPFFFKLNKLSKLEACYSLGEDSFRILRKT